MSTTLQSLPLPEYLKGKPSTKVSWCHCTAQSKRAITATTPDPIFDTFILFVNCAHIAGTTYQNCQDFIHNGYPPATIRYKLL